MIVKKPFDLQKALEGCPLITRDGQIVREFHYLPSLNRIICVIKEEAINFYISGRLLEMAETPLDIFIYGYEEDKYTICPACGKENVYLKGDLKDTWRYGCHSCSVFTLLFSEQEEAFDCWKQFIDRMQNEKTI